MRPSMPRHRHRHRLLNAALAAAFGAASFSLLLSPAGALAQAAGAADSGARAFDVQVPAQDLSSALNELSRQTGVPVFAAGDVVGGVSSRTVAGRLTIEEALRQVLVGTALQASKAPNGGFAIHRAGPAAKPSESALPPVRVTASAEPAERATGPVSGYVARRSATATKTDTPLIETPQSISVVTAERAQAIGATRLTEALGYTPGVGVEPFGSDSRHDTLTIRGFNAFTPGFYLDGMQMRNINSFSTWHTENYGAERTEVLRGPSSVLYGQNIAGGMVNVVSKRPTAEPLRELQVQIGSDARRQVAGDFSGPLDAEGRVLYRVTGLTRESDLQLAGLPDDRQFLAPSLTWRATNDTTLTVLTQYLRGRAGTDWRFYPLEGTLQPNPNGPIPRATFLGEPAANRFDYDQWMAGYLLEHRFDERWAVRHNARQGRQDMDYLDIFAVGNYAVVDAANPGNPANHRRLIRVFSGSREDAKIFTTDNHVEGKLRSGDWQHTLLAGLDHQRTRIEAVSLGGGSVPSLDLYAPSYGGALGLPGDAASTDMQLKQTGVYVQNQAKFRERWVATVGGRQDFAASRTLNRLSGVATESSDHQFSGRVGGVYLHPSGVAPYVSYAESFSPNTTIDPATGNAFKPETGKQYEAGVRYQPPGGKDSYSAAVFELRRRNYITFDPAFVPKQTGEITVRGLELEAMVQPLRSLNLSAAYTWTPKADVTASSNPLEVGQQSTAVSEQQLSMWGDYRFSGGFKAGLGVRHVGANHGTDEFLAALGERVPAYTLVDAMVGYQMGHWNLALNLRNLTDKAFLSGCGYGSCNYGEPRRVTATAVYRW
jgi:iron complex outermembrane receptor protein